MNTGLAYVLLVVLFVYSACCLLLFLTQRSFIYYPTPATDNPLARELRVASGGESLQVWQLNAGQAEAILYFGGNAEDVAANSVDFLQLFPGHTVYLVNYRGFGGSSGSPSEGALFADAEAIYDVISAQHQRVHALGRSLGSGVAVYLAGTRELGKLALVTPYDSIAEVAAGAMPLFPVRWLLLDRYDSRQRAGGLNNTVLLLLAERDRVIPRQRSLALMEAFKPGLVEQGIIAGADHNDIGLARDYRHSLERYFRN
jgi:pimeloyl-ACP methyl ester carboxylesterase